MTQTPEPSSPKSTSTKIWALATLGFVVTLLAGLTIGLRLQPKATLSGAATPAQSVIDTSPSTDSPTPVANNDFMTFLLSDARHFQGDANAPVTLIEFSDFK